MPGDSLASTRPIYFVDSPAEPFDDGAFTCRRNGRDPMRWAKYLCLVAALQASSIRADDRPPVAHRTDVKADVAVSDDGTMFTLSNGIVSAKINKRNGDLESLV